MSDGRAPANFKAWLSTLITGVAGVWFVRPMIGPGFLGIRPEDFLPSVPDGGAAIDLKVEVLEVLGADQFLYGKVGADDLTARVDPHLKVSVGDMVRMGINTRRLHLFDAESEQAVF